MKLNKKIILGFVLAISLGAGVWYYTATDRGPIYEFNYDRDSKEILNIFDKDWYWLVADSRDQYSPDFMLKHRAPRSSRMWAGRMHLKVLREKDQFVGFTAYYKKSDDTWFFNFLAIKPEFRGKKYASKLVEYALDDMKSRGAKQINLITRPSNKAAQATYRKAGFTETFNDGEYVGFTYLVN